MKKIFVVLFMLSALVSKAQTGQGMPPLLYQTDALEPVMSKETLEYHYGKHVKAYVDNLAKLVPGTEYAGASLEEISRNATGAIFNNGAQILNHIYFFDMFAPEAKARKAPTGKLAAAITDNFGSLDNFKRLFSNAAGGVFGSGWTWLVADAKGDLEIVSYPNAGNPLKDGYTPLLGVDVWEHSYYIDYRNRRADYLNNLWRIIDWKVIEERY